MSVANALYAGKVNCRNPAEQHKGHVGLAQVGDDTVRLNLLAQSCPPGRQTVTPLFCQPGKALRDLLKLSGNGAHPPLDLRQGEIRRSRAELRRQAEAGDIFLAQDILDLAGKLGREDDEHGPCSAIDVAGDHLGAARRQLEDAPGHKIKRRERGLAGEHADRRIARLVSRIRDEGQELA